MTTCTKKVGTLLELAKTLKSEMNFANLGKTYQLISARMKMSGYSLFSTSQSPNVPLEIRNSDKGFLL